MADPNFPRGDGDPFGGPTLPVADLPMTPDFSAVLMKFRVDDRYYGKRIIRIEWQDPKGEAEDLLLALWRLWMDDPETRARIAAQGALSLTF